LEQDQISITAIMTAFMRGYHATYDTPKIFDDFLACRLLPEDRRSMIEQGFLQALQIENSTISVLQPEQRAAVTGMLITMGSSNVICRSAYTEGHLENAVRQGIGQYVILGAGMDTFAFRRPDLLEKLTVFEVDHPSMQDFKRSRIEELGWNKPPQLQFVAVDFTRDNLADKLTQSSFDPNEKSFFSWLGVTMYLTREESLTTLASIAHIASAGSMIIFDYLDTDAPSQAATEVRATLARTVNEPIKSGFDPCSLADDLERCDLRLAENLDQADIEKRYLKNRTDGYRAAKNQHLAYAIAK
jgi:methyltransferase (TIGR00027 family)